MNCYDDNKLMRENGLINRIQQLKLTHTPTSYFREGNEGLRKDNPIKSQTWVKLAGFFTKAEAQAAAKAAGWLASDVVRLYGRFESKWCVGAVHQQTLLKPEYWEAKPCILCGANGSHLCVAD